MRPSSTATPHGRAPTDFAALPFDIAEALPIEPNARPTNSRAKTRIQATASRRATPGEPTLAEQIGQCADYTIDITCKNAVRIIMMMERTAAVRRIFDLSLIHI